MEPEQPVDENKTLSEEEYQQIIFDWNDTAADYPDDLCVHQLFEAQVARTPDAIAVIIEEQQLTYNELNTKANQLAHYLKKRGVGADVLVALCILRSIDMIVGLLGILKAGGAYVPLDPEYPTERLSFMLEDTQAPILLTQISLAETLAGHRAEIICLDNDCEVIRQEDTENLINDTNAESLAYIIYTSGSTGKPKGAMIQHCSVVRLVCNTNYINLSAEDNIAQASNVSFDAATFEIWGALLNGARLTIIDKVDILSANIFARVIEQQGINTLFLTTALFNQLVQQSPETFNSIKTLLFGGEAVDPRWVEKILKNGGPENLLHVYGPTESTTFTTYYPIVNTSNNIKSIPIGKPIANTQTYILDNMLQPLPVGVAGELYIGGDGLARGYLNRPELTAEKFIPNPFSDKPASRLYKTCDKVRYLPDGNIEFLGRLDHQVKLRGFRIELGEIEVALMQHPAINNAVVTLREDRPGDKRMVAYLTAEHDQPDTAELRTFLGETLPDYMLPSGYVVLSEFPLTPNGKIDRAALPVPDQSRADESEHHVEPRSPVEEMLADLWADLLNLERVGIHDDFFELGGDSLLAVQLATRIGEKFNKNFLVEGVFKHPTIQSQAELLQDFTTTEFNPFTEIITPVRRTGSKIPLFWLFGGKIVSSIGSHIDSERPFYFLNHQTLVDGKPARYTDIKSMAEYYLELIQAIEPEGPYILGGFSVGGLIAYEMAQQLNQDKESVQLLFLLSPSPPGKDFRQFHQEMSNKALFLKHKRRLNSLGYKAYFSDLIRRSNSIRKEYIKKYKGKLAMQYYLQQDKPLPVGLRSDYIDKINITAIQHYKPPYTPPPINKTILVHEERFLTENDFYRQQWQKMCSGELEFNAFDNHHLELIETSESSEWLKILSNGLDACS